MYIWLLGRRVGFGICFLQYQEFKESHTYKVFALLLSYIHSCESLIYLQILIVKNS